MPPSLGILFQFSIDIFLSKSLENYSFLRPHIIFWGPNYSFYTQITKIFKKFCLSSLGILFQFSFDIFWSKTLENYSFLRPQIIFWGLNYTFLYTNNIKIFKKNLPCFAQHTIQILNWHILIKNIRKLFILRHQIIFESQITPFYTQITQTFSKKFCFTLLNILAYLNSQLTYFDQKTFKHFQASHLHMNLGILFKWIFPFYKWYKLL